MQTKTSAFLITAVKKVSSRIIRDFGEIESMLNIPKTAMDFALSCDSYVKSTLGKDLTNIKKNYGLITTDNVIKGIDSSNSFYVHGLVGLDNFYRCIPHFCVAVSLVRDNALFATVIHNPITNETYYAEKDLGSFYNKKRLYAQNQTQKPLDYLITDKEACKTLQFNKYHSVFISTCKILELCYLAAKKVNNCIFINPEKYWLVYPGLFILKEAGYTIDYEVSEDKQYISRVTYENKAI